MMRRLFPILFSLLLMPACVHRPMVEVRSLLEEAEGMMHTSPDTAYFLLLEMGTTMDLGTEADSAYHSLLLMEARTKNGMKLTDVSAIRKLMSYYQGQQDSLPRLRLLRLLAVTRRDNGCYEDAAHSYRVAIGIARRMGEKRLLADMYYELAHLHYSAHWVLNLDFCKQFSDQSLALTIQAAKELGDSVLWMKSLIPPALATEQQEGMADYEQQLLQALDLAVALKDSVTEATVSMYLSLVYGETGEYEKVLPYVKRSLSLRQIDSSASVFCLALGHAYQRIGMQDSAAYYLDKGNEQKKQESLARLSTLPGRDGIDFTEMFMGRLRQKEELERESEQKFHVYAFLWMVVLVVVVVLLVYLVRKSNLRYRKDLQEQRSESECKQQQLCETEEQLKQTEEALKNEKEVLMRKEREIESLQSQLDKFLSETGSVHDKIKQIIADFRHKESSDLDMKESDWALLQLALDKQWNGAVTHIRQEFQLSDMEIRLFCLHLMGVATSHMLYFFDISRTNLYCKNQEMLGKIGVDRTSATFKEDIRRFMKDWE